MLSNSFGNGFSIWHLFLGELRENEIGETIKALCLLFLFALLIAFDFFQLVS